MTRFTVRTSHLVAMAVLFVGVSTPGATHAQGVGRDTCANAVQGRIAWDYRDSRQWLPANVDRLCGGAEDSVSPAECFEKAMFGGVEHGSGTRWAWQDAVDLCAGTLDADATIGCFSSRIASGRNQAQAIASCRWDRDSRSGDEPPGYVPFHPRQPPVEIPPAEPLREATSWATSSAEAVHVNGVPTVAASRPLRGATALRSFELFFRGDHKIRRIAVLGDDRFARFAFNDKEGEDSFWASARWAVFSAGRPASLSAAARGQVELEIEPGPPGHTFAISGFEFRRLDGTDANVRSLGIWPVLERNAIQVWLIDDMGPDFRGLEETLGASLAAGALVPFGGAVVGGLASTWDAVSRFSAQGGPRPYQVTVQYSWIPDDVFGDEGAASGTSALNLDGWKPDAEHVLQGFRFLFENSDHHLEALGVTLANEHHLVQFRDGDWDDPMQWAVQYRELRPEREE